MWKFLELWRSSGWSTVFRVLLCGLVFYFRSCCLGYLVCRPPSLLVESMVIGAANMAKPHRPRKCIEYWTWHNHRFPCQLQRPWSGVSVAEIRRKMRERYRSCSLMPSVSVKVARWSMPPTDVLRCRDSALARRREMHRGSRGPRPRLPTCTPWCSVCASSLAEGFAGRETSAGTGEWEYAYHVCQRHVCCSSKVTMWTACFPSHPVPSLFFFPLFCRFVKSWRGRQLSLRLFFFSRWSPS